MEDENKTGFSMNEFHRRNSQACQEAIQRMQSRPLSREEKIAQIKRVHEQSLARRNGQPRPPRHID